MNSAEGEKQQRRYEKVTMRHSCEISILYQQTKMPMKSIVKLFPQYSQATIYRHAKKKVGDTSKKSGSGKKKGRPSKLNNGEKERIVRSIDVLRETDGSFTSPRVAVKAGVETKVSNRTVRRVLNKSGFGYYSTRRKGMLTKLDFQKRIEYCERVISKNLGAEFWTKNVAFYMDGTGFEFKTNPFDQARAPKAREWRKPDEGLTVTGKGKKEGVVSTNFMVGISYDNGVVLCEHYEGAINGEKMAKIVDKGFTKAFRKSVCPRTKRFVMDGCPRQNSKKARDAYDRVGAMVMKIPAKSPDLNPIENFFHLVKKELKKQAISKKIMRETMVEYNKRIVRTLNSFPVTTINNLISSMDKRVHMVLEADGHRIKY